MAALKHLLPWVDRLTGIDPDRARRSIDVLPTWGIPQLNERLGKPRSLDDVVRAVLLVEDVEQLTTRGVPRTKLLSKLRDVGQFEATWAELRCAALLATTADEDVAVELEAGKADGTHADVRLLLPEGPPHTSVEIKAVGLADSEVAFCARMAPALHTVIPPLGIATLHAGIDGPPPKWTAADAAHARQHGLRVAAQFPQYFGEFAAAVIVARETEGQYLRRAAARVAQAVRQLPVSDECWVALYWTNGAPVDDVAAAIDWSMLPEHVAGLLFIGCVLAFPHRNIDCFQMSVPRGYGGAGRQVESEYNEEIAELILDRTLDSAGVRATLIRGVIGGKRRQILLRDGSERIPAFNVVLDGDASGPMLAGRGKN